MFGDDSHKNETESYDRKADPDSDPDGTCAHSSDETGVCEGEGPGEVIGNFRLIEPLGAGGFGTVWLAEQSEPVRRQVALKMLNPGMNSREIVARFAQERQALAVMDHSGIARVYDAGVTRLGRPFFVMELVRGVPLDVYCNERRLDTLDRLKLFIDVCHAVQHAHQKGIIHRDLKPSNILVSDGDKGPCPKIIDFGIAKATTEPLTDDTLQTRIGQSIGTPAYMSPEQALGMSHDIDIRSDVYSLGVILYGLLTGLKLFDDRGTQRINREEFLRRIREQIPPRPSTRLRALTDDELALTARANGQEPQRLIQSVRGDLDWIVMKALEKDRTRRYDTVSDFATDIRRHLANEPVMARPPTAGYLMRRFVSRNRGAVIAASLIMLTLVTGLAVSTTMLFREAAARQKADKAALRAQHSARFLERMLESVGPSKALGRDTTMLREVLDATAARVKDDLGEWPDLEAELRTVLGRTYDDLSEYEQALEMHHEALRLRRMIFAPNHPLIAESLYEVASTLDFTDGLLEAESNLREAIDIESLLRPTRPGNLGEARDLLAWILLRQGKLAEAESICRMMLDSMPANDPELQPIRTRSLNTLGSVLHKGGQFAESEKVHRQCLQESIDLHGPNSPRVVTSINNLCHVLVKTGKFDEVEKLANQALALGKQVTGKSISSATDSLHKALALACESRGDVAGAIEHLEIAVDAASQMFGADHGFCNDKRTLLARMQIAAGQLDEAEITIAETRANGGTDSAENSLDVVASQLALAKGNFVVAVELARGELDRIRKATNTPSIQTIDALQALAAAQLAQGEQKKAESTLREAIEILNPALNAGTPMLVGLEKDLARVLEARNKNECCFCRQRVFAGPGLVRSRKVARRSPPCPPGNDHPTSMKPVTSSKTRTWCARANSRHFFLEFAGLCRTLQLRLLTISS